MRPESVKAKTNSTPGLGRFRFRLDDETGPGYHAVWFGIPGLKSRTRSVLNTYRRSRRRPSRRIDSVPAIRLIHRKRCGASVSRAHSVRDKPRDTPGGTGICGVGRPACRSNQSLGLATDEQNMPYGGRGRKEKTRCNAAPRIVVQLYCRLRDAVRKERSGSERLLSFEYERGGDQFGQETLGAAESRDYSRRRHLRVKPVRPCAAGRPEHPPCPAGGG